MWFVWTMQAALAAEPVAEDAEARARALSRAGVIEIGSGIGGVAAGVVVMLVGRGEPGELSNESQRTADLRSAGGAALIIGGFTTALVGGNNLGRARAYREIGEQVTVGASIDRRGAALRISGRF